MRIGRMMLGVLRGVSRSIHSSLDGCTTDADGDIVDLKAVFKQEFVSLKFFLWWGG